VTTYYSIEIVAATSEYYFTLDLKSVILVALINYFLTDMSLTQLNTYTSLLQHYAEIKPLRMQSWFENDPMRYDTFSFQLGELLLDYSKNRITEETIKLLCQLAKDAHLEKKINDLFVGHPVNTTEKRAALHTKLRDRKNFPLEVKTCFERIKLFTEKLHHQQWFDNSNENEITDIINVGIGGSHLGPMMTTEALSHLSHPKFRCHFISNIDETHLNAVLKIINPKKSLFIISSKSFSTIETITNAKKIKTWLKDFVPNLEKHFVAVTAVPEKAIAFGIPEDQIFKMWDWVGGRYSIWSSVGLSLALMIGMDNFFAFLDGAHAMDVHFRESPFEKNMPVILALLGIWYINFFNASNHLILPYAEALNTFPLYLQQLDMESNGKSISMEGTNTNYATGPLIFGVQGVNGQHSFYQLLHQGPHLVPADFILLGTQDEMLIASALSQTQALMRGKSKQEAFQEMINKNFTSDEAEFLSSHQTVPGNKPSNTLFLNRLTPYNLGALIALYEHKIYAQGAIWNINSFDQWGVELGKQILNDILKEIQQDETNSNQDASTYGLLMHYKKMRSLV